MLPLRSTIPALPPGLIYGGDYNPEQWPEAVWAEDVRLMTEAGVNMVCVGIFSWAKLEPERGRYEFGWMDRIVGQLWASGISVCLATGTASPPAWLARRHPESLPVNSHGVRLGFGSRQQYCPSSEAYREASSALITQIATRYGRHPAVALWHINNEIGCHVTECHCPTCAGAFRRWLRERYGDLDALNAAWGTTFWSQRYGEWEEISTPHAMPTITNPAQALDYQRFMNHALMGVMLSEIADVRAVVPEAKVTTNGVSWNKPADYREWYQHCDVAALDCYPDPAEGLAAAHEAAICHDLYRSFKGGLPFILMEQATSHVNWRPYNGPKAPGQMRAGSLATVGRGGDGIMFFQWRASQAGAEKFHSAMLPHLGAESRTHREVRQLGGDLQKLAAVAGGRTPARVALLAGWNNRWALELESKPMPFQYQDVLRAWHRPLWEANVGVDMLEPGACLDGYDLVLAPTLYQMSRAQGEELRRYVAQGGTLVLGYFSGIVDENERVWLGGYPALLSDVLGMVVEEWQPVVPPAARSVRFSDGTTAACTGLCEVVQARGAEVLAVFAEDYFAGSAALTRHRHGSGEAYYLATQLAPEAMRTFLDGLLAAHGIVPPVAASPGVQADVRQTDGEEFLFVTNQQAAPGRVDLGSWSGTVDMLTGAPVGTDAVLAGFASLVLRRQIHPSTTV